MDEDFTTKLNYLRLNCLLAEWDRFIETAQQGKWSPVRLLKEIVEAEYQAKKENARKSRLNRAKIPEPLVMETYPFEKQRRLNRKKVMSIYDSFEFMKNRQNIIWVGPTGTGKTGLATAFLVEAINKGYTGRFIAFAELIELLYQSVADHSEKKVIKRFSSYDCLLIDELGYVEIEPVQVGLFFTLMSNRHKTKSTLVTSNLGFTEWTTFLKNDHLTAALVDRLTENSHVINMKNCITLRQKLEQS